MLLILYVSSVAMYLLAPVGCRIDPKGPSNIYIYIHVYQPNPWDWFFAAFSPADLHHAVLVALVASEDPNLHHCPLHLTSPQKHQPGLHGSEDEAQPTPQDWDQLGTWVKGSRVFLGSSLVTFQIFNRDLEPSNKNGVKAHHQKTECWYQ